MGEGVPGLAQAYHYLFTAALIFLAIMLILCLIRAVIGPRVADRIVAVNMMSTMVMVIIAILTLMLEEGYLADICLIYAMISFLAVIVLTKVYMGVYLEKKASAEESDSKHSIGSAIRERETIKKSAVKETTRKELEKGKAAAKRREEGNADGGI